MKIWNKFKKWIVNKEFHAERDCEEMISSAFQIAQSEIICRCKAEDEDYEYCKIKEDSENYFKTEDKQERLKWKNVLGRKFKGDVVKIIIYLGKEVAPST